MCARVLLSGIQSDYQQITLAGQWISARFASARE
jgi:hypothetical protein